MIASMLILTIIDVANARSNCRSQADKEAIADMLDRGVTCQKDLTVCDKGYKVCKQLKIKYRSKIALLIQDLNLHKINNANLKTVNESKDNSMKEQKQLTDMAMTANKREVSRTKWMYLFIGLGGGAVASLLITLLIVFLI